MSKETRHNLIFLGLFLAISLPGAAMLFRAKLDPEARIMYMPPSVRKTLAYMVPHATAGDVVRTQPAQVMRFVEDLMDASPGRMPLRRDAPGGRKEPIISIGRHYELLDIQYLDNTVTAHVLLWTPGRGAERHASGRVGVSDQWEARIKNAKTRAIPEDIREVLREHGYTNPPSRVIWLEVQCSPRMVGASDPPPPVPPELVFDPEDSNPLLPSDVLKFPDTFGPTPDLAAGDPM